MQAEGDDGEFDIFDGGSGDDTFQVIGKSALTLAGFDATANSIENWLGNGKELKGTDAGDVFDFSGLTSVTGFKFVDAGKGDDTLVGSNVADDLRGGKGNDTLRGGGGDDQLAGGKGTDGFVFNVGDGNDTIMDLSFDKKNPVLDDHIDLTGFGTDYQTDVHDLMTQVGKNVVIDFGGGDTLTILKTTIAILDAHQADFHLV